MSNLFENLVLPFESKKPVVVEDTIPYAQLISGTLFGGEEIKPGVLHFKNLHNYRYVKRVINFKSVFTW